MNKFNFSSVSRLVYFTIKTNRKQIIGWCIAIFSLMFMYMILFPSVKDMAQIKMDAMPKEMLQFVGMDNFSDMGNYISYFGIIFNLLLVAISIFAASFNANLILKEEQTKTIEFLNSLQVSRCEIYVSKFISGFLAVLLVLCSSIFSAAICGIINGGETFILSDFIKIIKVSGFTPFFYVSIALMLAGLSAKIGASMIASMSVLVLYVFGFLSTMLESKIPWLSYFSPFESFSPNNALALTSNTAITLAVYFLLFTTFLIVGGVGYKRRDLNI